MRLEDGRTRIPYSYLGVAQLMNAMHKSPLTSKTRRLASSLFLSLHGSSLFVVRPRRYDLLKASLEERWNQTALDINTNAVPLVATTPAVGGERYVFIFRCHSIIDRGLNSFMNLKEMSTQGSTRLNLKRKVSESVSGE